MLRHRRVGLGLAAIGAALGASACAEQPPVTPPDQLALAAPSREVVSPAIDTDRTDPTGFTDTSAAPPRASVEPAAHGTTIAALHGTLPRWSASRLAESDVRRRLDFSVELASESGRAQPFADSLQAVRIGWRWRMRDQVALVDGRPDLLSAQLAESTVTRVGLQWQPAPSQIALLRGGLGLQWQGMPHMSIRLRKGSFGIYMNRKF